MNVTTILNSTYSKNIKYAGIVKTHMIFQLLDVDYVFSNGKTILRLIGKTENDNSVCIFYDNFFPYFYIEPKQNVIEKLKEIKEIKSIEETEKLIPFGYSETPKKMLKLTLFNPQDVPKVRDMLIVQKIAEKTYEADILFKYRFMADHNMKGMQWIDADCKKLQTKTVKTQPYYATKISPIEKTGNAKLRYLSFDIECLPFDATKPIDAKTNPIIIISMAFLPEYNNKKTLMLMTKPSSRNDTLSFSTEKEMLEEFIKIIDNYDPDIITGYNINNFDIPYILDRMMVNKIRPTLGRCADKPAYTRQVAASQEPVVQGRIVVDPYQILKRDPWQKFHKYDLNTVAKKLVNEGKIDVAYSDMIGLWNGNQEGIDKLVEYAKKDAELPLKIIIEKGLLEKFFEISKISGVLLQDCFGGQTTRIEVMLLHEFIRKNFIMPNRPQKHELIKREEERTLKGALVLEPKKGLHADGCTLVLDFTSLYPSIIRTYNISPDTLVTGETNVKYATSPLGTKFVDKSVRYGILPMTVEKLVTARRNVKKDMKTATGEAKKILNARQLALKDISNSIYGHTGYVRARLYMLDVASTITAYGRENIENTKKIIEDNFGVEVIYGDTDSIFVKTKITNLDEAKELGEKISKYVTENLPGQLELLFEKIYRTFLILTKKRYVGWSFKYDDKWKDSIDMRGIETIRRDWCPLVSELQEEIISIILKEGDPQKAITMVKNTIEKLKKGEIGLEKLTVIKSITKSIGSYDGMLPHIELARKIMLRNPQEPPKVGDRLSYVIIKGNQMLSKRAEDPEYVKKHKIDIDADYYIENQILPPIERLFAAMNVGRSEFFGLGRQISLGDILNGKKHREKHQITFEFKDEKPLANWEEFICKSCKKSYKRFPLQGLCECGGELVIGYQGNVGNKVNIS